MTHSFPSPSRKLVAAIALASAVLGGCRAPFGYGSGEPVMIEHPEGVSVDSETQYIVGHCAECGPMRGPLFSAFDMRRAAGCPPMHRRLLHRHHQGAPEQEAYIIPEGPALLPVPTRPVFGAPQGGREAGLLESGLLMQTPPTVPQDTVPLAPPPEIDPPTYPTPLRPMPGGSPEAIEPPPLKSIVPMTGGPALTPHAARVDAGWRAAPR